jgi:hypothetical protein
MSCAKCVLYAEPVDTSAQLEEIATRGDRDHFRDEEGPRSMATLREGLAKHTDKHQKGAWKAQNDLSKKTPPVFPQETPKEETPMAFKSIFEKLNPEATKIVKALVKSDETNYAVWFAEIVGEDEEAAKSNASALRGFIMNQRGKKTTKAATPKAKKRVAKKAKRKTATPKAKKGVAKKKPDGNGHLVKAFRVTAVEDTPDRLDLLEPAVQIVKMLADLSHGDRARVLEAVDNLFCLGSG